MGVSLERVQNKFACIIGELCSEPFILSQFAVWVDLRIAEYKTKGTISLDCSGDPPNPGWMKGVKNVPQRSGSNTVDTGQAANRRRGSYTNSPSIQMSPSASPMSNQMYNERLQSTDSRVPHINSGQQQSFETRLSPDIVVIKNEPSPPDQQSSCAFVRKRSADGTDLQSDYYSPSKSRRLTGPSSSALPSSAQESSSNQSLMSIINTESDSITLEPVESQDDIFKVTMDMQEELRKSQGLTASPSNSTFSPRRPTATATSSSSSPNNQSWLGSTGADAGQGTSSQAAFGHYLVTNSRQSLAFGTVDPSGETETGAAYSASLKRKAHTAVAIFKAWLVEQREYRRVEHLPPARLDELLVVFFRTLKKQNGADYLPNSLKALRTGLAFYLKMRGYQELIAKSPYFILSQHAYRQKLMELEDRFSANPNAVSTSLNIGNTEEEVTFLSSMTSGLSSTLQVSSPGTTASTSTFETSVVTTAPTPAYQTVGITESTPTVVKSENIGESTSD